MILDMSGSREVSWMSKYSFCKRAGKYLGYIRHEGMQVGAQRWDRNLEWELVAFAACGWYQLWSTDGKCSQCLLATGAGLLFQNSWKQRVKGSEDKRCKDHLSPTLCLLLFGKKVPQQPFPARVCAGECKAEVGICVTCGLYYFYKNRKTTNYFRHCTNTSSLGSSKYEVN